MRTFRDYENMAMLDLPDLERAGLEARFDEIAGGFTVLDDYSTDGVLPLVSVLDVHNVLREDVAAKLFSGDEVLENAPEKHDGYFQVPAAID
jgi:aspartyl-tRNA(Asn)/glutamyl-tRNA(Gln) amidotransferase subunit C